MASAQNSDAEDITVTVTPKHPSLPGPVLFVHEDHTEPCQVAVRLPGLTDSSADLTINLVNSQGGIRHCIFTQAVHLESQRATVPFDEGIQLFGCDSLEVVHGDSTRSARIPQVGEAHAAVAIASFLAGTFEIFKVGGNSRDLSDSDGRTIAARASGVREIRYDYEEYPVVECIEHPPRKHTFFDKFMNPSLINDGTEHDGYVEEVTHWKERVARSYAVVRFRGEVGIRDTRLIADSGAGMRVSRSSLPTYTLPNEVAVGPKYRLAILEHSMSTVPLLDDRLLSALEAHVWTTVSPLVLDRHGLSCTSTACDARSLVAFIDTFMTVSDFLRKRVSATRGIGVSISAT